MLTMADICSPPSQSLSKPLGNLRWFARRISAWQAQQSEATAPVGCGGKVDGVKHALAEGADAGVERRRHVGVSVKAGVKVRRDVT